MAGFSWIDPSRLTRTFLILCLIFELPSISASSTLMESSPTSPPVIGIDLGTSYSRVAVMKNYFAQAIPDQFDHRAIPSWVSFPEHEGTLTGEAAKRAHYIPEGNSIFNIKGIIGRPIDDLSVQRSENDLPPKPTPRTGLPKIQVRQGGESIYLSAEEILANTLTELKQMAETFLEENITRAVVTVPAYFDNVQHQVIKDAGAIAGLDILRVINDSMAAAARSWYGYSSTESSYRIIYDLGGTFTVSLLRTEGEIFSIVATAGSTDIGGEAFDHRMVDYLVTLGQARTGVDMRSNSRILKRLKYEVELAKWALSTRTSVDVVIESFYGGKDFSETLTREKFEELNMDLFLKTIESINEVLLSAGIRKEDVAGFMLVGGSTRIPTIRALVTDFFDGKRPYETSKPHEEVVLGAALYGQIFANRYYAGKFVFGDISVFSFAIRTLDGVVTELIPPHTTVPITITRSFSTSAEHPSAFVFFITMLGDGFDDYHPLQKVELTGIQVASHSQAQIDVTFNLSSTGNLTVLATSGQITKSVELTAADLLSGAVWDEGEYQWTQSLTRLQEYLSHLKNDLFNLGELGGMMLETDRRAVLALVGETEGWIYQGIRHVEREALDAKLAEVRGLVAVFTGPSVAQVCAEILPSPPPSTFSF